MFPDDVYSARRAGNESSRVTISGLEYLKQALPALRLRLEGIRSIDVREGTGYWNRACHNKRTNTSSRRPKSLGTGYLSIMHTSAVSLMLRGNTKAEGRNCENCTITAQNFGNTPLYIGYCHNSPPFGETTIGTFSNFFVTKNSEMSSFGRVGIGIR